MIGLTQLVSLDRLCGFTLRFLCCSLVFFAAWALNTFYVEYPVRIREGHSVPVRYLNQFLLLNLLPLTLSEFAVIVSVVCYWPRIFRS